MNPVNRTANENDFYSTPFIDMKLYMHKLNNVRVIINVSHSIGIESINVHYAFVYSRLDHKQ